VSAVRIHVRNLQFQLLYLQIYLSNHLLYLRILLPNHYLRPQLQPYLKP
jgi:hypothetical protein